MPRPLPHPAARSAFLSLVLLFLPIAADAAPWSASLSRKVDPSLAGWVSGGSDTLTVWIAFASRASQDPAAYAAGLADAAAALTPRARARRLRAGVRPLVDERDLPVDPRNLEELRGLGLAPFAVSRWFNRAAVRATPAEVARAVALDAVVAIAPVPLSAPPARGPAGTPVILGGAKPRARANTAFDDAGIAASQLAQIDATGLHDAGFTGEGVLVALFDEGFNFAHEHAALRDRVFPPGFERDFVDGDAVASDTTRPFGFSHGTWTLGCLAGNRPGVYRGSGFGADVAIARTEDHFVEQPVEMLYWTQAAEWADSLGADIISSSVGYARFDSSFTSYGPGDLDGHTTDISRAAEIAAAKGILVVNSAGNNGRGPAPRLVAPADVNGDSLIAVGAVDSLGNVDGLSSRGPTSDGRIKPDLVARGRAAWVVSAGGDPDAYLTLDGTSFSAPLVAGLAACLMQARPDLAPTGIIRALRETASAHCCPDQDQGWGVPDGLAARDWVPGPGPEFPPAGYLEMTAASGNPFRSTHGPLRVVFGLGPRLGETSKARLRVFDSAGRLVRTLFYGSLTCGNWQTVEWNGRDPQGRVARPGMYFVHFDAEGRTRTLRVVLLD